MILLDIGSYNFLRVARLGSSKSLFVEVDDGNLPILRRTSPERGPDTRITARAQRIPPTTTGKVHTVVPGEM